MKLVSDRSSAEIAEAQARQELELSLRDLAANIIRVTRGAGKSWEIGRQCVSLLEAMGEYRKAAGSYPSSEVISRALSIESEAMPELSDDDLVWQDAENDMVKGGLQMAASHLLGQRTQYAAGQRELMDGFAVIERIREQKRAASNVLSRRRSKTTKS